MKLWIVTVECEYMALAESAQTARRMAREALGDMQIDSFAYSEPYTGRLAQGYKPQHLLYHDQGRKDITVAEAIDLVSKAA